MKSLPLFAALLILFSTPALAHRVNIHAWPDGDSVRVHCGFSRNSPAKDSRVTVYDAADGKELLSGVTDGNGDFRFAVPEQAHTDGLRIRVNAGAGHENEWRMESREFARNSDAPDQIRPDSQNPPTVHFDNSTTAMPARNDVLALTEVRVVVSEVLEAKLAPLRRDVAALSNPEPGVREIVGGLGWLVGLAGITLYLRSREQGRRVFPTVKQVSQA
ncbi:MAG: cobalamin biosynthesis protein CbiL [Desulfovibrio sp.]|nr:cobalamin biosynthesis protein CbiL [Desulfovibrio sp.]